jgi:pimeloyl-ACP methyl ester carboxylesterase
MSPADVSDGDPPEPTDEFGLLHQNAAEAGLAWEGPPPARRVWFEAPSGHRVSGLQWGTGTPEVVLVHGGMQNAHTWDTVVLALDRPTLAVDLPGHGRSDWRADRDYRPQRMADDVAAMIDAFTAGAALLAGMSLGGLTSLAVAAQHADVAEHLALVDITPGVNRHKARDIIDFVSGPEVFESFEAILERTMAFNPTRSEASLRRGILHNARPQADGTWVWRYDLPTNEGLDDLDHRFADLWDAVEVAGETLTLFQGDRSPVVDAEDVAEVRRRRPDARHIVVEDAGHSIQGDQPLVLARHLRRLLTGS